jgi:Fe-S-cluster containining protein
MKPIIKIINVNLTSITSDEPIEDVPCGSCTLCCEKLSPYLTVEEIQSGLYPLSLLNPTDPSNPEAGPIVALYRKKEGGCGMFVDGKCSIYNYRPIACRQFDCRKGHHPTIPNMVNK